MKQHLCKFCSEADPSNFYSGHKSTCKVCKKEQAKLQYESDPEATLLRNKKYYKSNKEKVLSAGQRWKQNNIERVQKANAQYRKANRDKILVYLNNYYQENRDTLRTASQSWKAVNKESNRKQQRGYEKQKRHTDPAYKFIHNLRIRQRVVLKGKQSTTDGLGCSSEELKQHLKSLFQEGMTLENHGEWHIDHILPLSSHDKDSEGNWCTTSDYNKKLIHYTNLQPLWAEDNLKKSDKI